MNEIDQTHYMRALTQLGDRKAVINHEPIYTDNKVKLVDSGSRIDSSLFEHLIRHKLLKPIDESLSIEGMVDHRVLLGDANGLLASDPLLQRFQQGTANKYRLATVLPKLSLPLTIAVKLTVAREERFELYNHSLLSLIISLYAAAQGHLTENETIALASAALLHDLGLLHIDPALLAPQHRLTETERRHLYAHPIIGYLLLKPFDDYPEAVCNAIYEHHERLDGSGYPRGLTVKSIGMISQFLGVVEIIASRFDDEGHCKACQQLEFILKMNTSKLNPQLITLFSPIFPELRNQQAMPESADAEKLLACLAKVHSLLEQWQGVEQNDSTAPASAEVAFINGQLETLRTTLRYAGLDQGGLAQLLSDDGEDEEILQDFLIAISEVRWQLKGLWNEVTRRWPELAESSRNRAMAQWLTELKGL